MTSVLSPTQPKVAYDLLSPRSKSPSFVIMFHLEAPQYRFVIQHRAVHQCLKELDSECRTELIRVAATFTKDFDLSDTTLTIPHGKFNLARRRGHTFYAFLEVPCRMAFHKAFRALLSEIPLNTDARWHNPLWPPLNPREPVTDCYMRAVTTQPTGKLPLRPNHADRLNAFSFARQVKKKEITSETPQFWQFLQHSSLPLLGVAGTRSTTEWTLEHRLDALNTMEKLLRKNGHKKTACYLCVSLTDVYRFPCRSKRRPIGYMHFPEGIPEDLLDQEQVVRAHLKNGNDDIVDGPSQQENLGEDEKTVYEDETEVSQTPQSNTLNCFTFLRPKSRCRSD